MITGAIGGYPVSGELGRGATGVVLRGVDPRDGRPVAIKCLHAPGGLPPRFARELEALRALRHPGVVRVLDAGVDRGRAFLVMELVEGGSLEQRLSRQGPLPVLAAVRLVADVARTAAWVHGLGIVHRDIKPANVLLAPGGPKLTDFGLVKLLDHDHPRLSRTGELLGTPGYMAPEQAAGQPAAVGPATDVYGLGALLYAALTGSPPFRGEGSLEVLVATADRAPDPPSRLRPEVGPALDAVCLRCLAKDPEARFASAAELARELDAIAAPSRRPGALASLLVAALLAGGGAAAAFALLGGGELAAPPPTPPTAPRQAPPAAPSPGEGPTVAGWDAFAALAGLIDAATLAGLPAQARMEYLRDHWSAILSVGGQADALREAEVDRRVAGRALRLLHAVDLGGDGLEATPGLAATPVELVFRPEHGVTALRSCGTSALELAFELPAAPSLAVLRITGRASTLEGIRFAPVDVEVSGVPVAREWSPGLVPRDGPPEARFEVAGLLRAGTNRVVVRLSAWASMQCFLERVELLVPF